MLISISLMEMICNPISNHFFQKLIHYRSCRNQSQETICLGFPTSNKSHFHCRHLYNFITKQTKRVFLPCLLTVYFTRIFYFFPSKIMALFRFPHINKARDLSISSNQIPRRQPQISYVEFQKFPLNLNRSNYHLFITTSSSCSSHIDFAFRLFFSYSK